MVLHDCVRVWLNFNPYYLPDIVNASVANKSMEIDWMLLHTTPVHPTRPCSEWWKSCDKLQNSGSSCRFIGSVAKINPSTGCELRKWCETNRPLSGRQYEYTTHTFDGVNEIDGRSTQFVSNANNYTDTQNIALLSRIEYAKLVQTIYIYIYKYTHTCPSSSSSVDRRRRIAWRGGLTDAQTATGTVAGYSMSLLRPANVPHLARAKFAHGLCKRKRKSPADPRPSICSYILLNVQRSVAARFASGGGRCCCWFCIIGRI